MTLEGTEQSTSRHTQLLRGVVDICLLALIAERPRYGYELVEGLTERGLSLVSEGSVYPLLSRLERAKLLTSYREPSVAGPPRKYYRLTPAGVAELAAGRRVWTEFTSAVQRVLDLTGLPPTAPSPAPTVAVAPPQEDP